MIAILTADVLYQCYMKLWVMLQNYGHLFAGGELILLSCQQQFVTVNNATIPPFSHYHYRPITSMPNFRIYQLEIGHSKENRTNYNIVLLFTWSVVGREFQRLSNCSVHKYVVINCCKINNNNNTSHQVIYYSTWQQVYHTTGKS